MVTIDVNKIEYEKYDKNWNRLAKIWNNRKTAEKTGNRIYSFFHSLKSSERKWCKINNSSLKEVFDVSCCNLAIIGKMLEEKDVDSSELWLFQNIVRFGYFYNEIADYLNMDLIKNKKEIKSSVQRWLNIRDSQAYKGKFFDNYFEKIDEFFTVFFPSIRQILKAWREGENRGKVSKMLWEDFQKMEFEIITDKICTYLNKTYGVYPLSVHDAVYLSEEDCQKVKEDISEIFWSMLDLKFIK